MELVHLEEEFIEYKLKREQNGQNGTKAEKTKSWKTVDNNLLSMVGYPTAGGRIHVEKETSKEDSCAFMNEKNSEKEKYIEGKNRKSGRKREIRMESRTNPFKRGGATNGIRELKKSWLKASNKELWVQIEGLEGFIRLSRLSKVIRSSTESNYNLPAIIEDKRSKEFKKTEPTGRLPPYLPGSS
ncbi:hypothetical protein M9H77_13009 [Catharanthus roseus]|uniref:Uncharacterized protein n=1 Tax=Catharanthus roseus TaxID=4058 RepID=A0ACC0BJ45_CATRO|nr:hypothetical protein M9H77_13009 [Catharanthus roseus]